ncbi:unnamed protein product [Symbiodinium sp. CCMP2592]|nr:unnamed protein product [Symbiodinium sp. CCMP2592]
MGTNIREKHQWQRRAFRILKKCSHLSFQSRQPIRTWSCISIEIQSHLPVAVSEKEVCRETIPCSCVVMGGVLCCDEAGSTSQRSQRPQSPQKGRAKPYTNPLPTTPSDPWSSAMAAKNMPQIPKVSRSCFVCYTCAATDKVRKGTDLEAQLGAPPSLSNEAYKRSPIRRT